MATLPMIMIALGVAIILSLSVYAGYLLAKLQKQTRLIKAQEQKAIENRNLKIIESVDVIALAALQQQCDLSEASIRLYMIMDHLQGEKRVNFSERYPAIFALYGVVKDIPRGDARNTLVKKERMRLDYVRIQAEARLASEIESELKAILDFTGAKFLVIQPMPL